MVTRLTYFIVLFTSILIIWLLPLWYPISATMFGEFPTFHLIWKLIPIELTILWGIYAALSVLNAVRNVKDYPESQLELLDDIKQAKERLTEAGFDWN